MKNKAWLILCIIALVAAVALSATNLITKDRIAQQAAAAADSARLAAMPGATAFQAQPLADGAAITALYAGMDGDNLVGYVGEATVTGYGGPIDVVLGVDAAGKVTGMSVGGSEFAETAGLGAKTREPEFTNQFVGLSAAPSLGENVDAISGATISSTAVTKAAKAIYDSANALMTGGEMPTAEKPTEAPPVAPLATSQTAPARVAVKTVPNHEGDITVTVGLDAEGKIVSLDMGDGSISYGAVDEAARNQAFLAQFIGKTGPFTYGEGVDAVSGATVTSNAVLAAINAAYDEP